ncbi:MAG: aminotransferase class I/II-fold pyridoxal phosphate-dependent enzyme [Halobacteriovoraceae bacterium]|nr:aminotransferase class I/II-fold pyridoxal phosphate-dependent enzyme [Halobacteriovoraceae bacterium]
MISSRVRQIEDSHSRYLHQKASYLKSQGRYIYNLAHGELNIKPPIELLNNIKTHTNFLASFLYSDPQGQIALREKILHEFQNSRGVSLDGLENEFDCLISNGARHALSNMLGTILDPGDEVIIIRPYWSAYPQIVNFCRGVPVFVSSSVYDFYHPCIDDIEKVISMKTKAIIINSPNNPSGIHYSEGWMEEFAALMEKNPEIFIISDEIYSEMIYFDPAPTYFYQTSPNLLNRSIIISGISKTMAAAGLRIGHAICQRNLAKAAAKIQEQTTSGANSLIQRALVDYDFSKLRAYLSPIRQMLRQNSRILQRLFRDFNFSQVWYQTCSCYFFLIDFSKLPIIEKFRNPESNQTDYSVEICENILSEIGVAIGPGTDFGVENSGRISLILDEKHFEDALKKLLGYITK